MTIAERIQNLPKLQYKISTGEADAIQELKELYFLALNKTMKRECSSCRIRAYQDLVNLSTQNIENMSKPHKYVLKDKDALIQYKTDHYIASTITDDVAEAMIKDNKANEDLFEINPEYSETKKDKPAKSE